MAISTKCPGCGKRLTGPDTAAGHKVKCPKCGQIVTFPAGEAAETPASAKPRRPSAADLAQALSHKPEATGAKQERAAAQGRKGKTPKGEAAEASLPPSLTPASGWTPSRRSSTTMSRMLARNSPYKALRLLGVIIFIVSMVVGALVFVGGLVGLIVGVRMQALHPVAGVAVFLGGLVAAAATVLAGWAASELVHLWADVGDRTRHLTMMFEDTFVRQQADDSGSGVSR